MCRPIRSLTEGKGYEISKHRLGVFGGAGMHILEFNLPHLDVSQTLVYSQPLPFNVSHVLADSNLPIK